MSVRANVSASGVKKLVNMGTSLATAASMLAADQDQLESALGTINRIAQETQFGSQYLLDGSADNSIGISTNASDIEVAQNSTLSEGFHTITVSSVVDESQFIDNESLGLSDPASVDGLASGDHQVVVTQESVGATIAGDDIDFTNPLTIAAGTNDQFVLSLDGGADMTVTIAAAAYADADTLATAISTAVNTALSNASLSTAEITVDDSSDHLEFVTGDEGSASSISIHDTGLTNSALADINVTQQVTVGTDAIVTLDNQVNYIYDIDHMNTGTATLQDKDGNTVDFTVGIAGDGLTLGSTTLTFNAKSFLVDLDGEVQGRFEVGKTDTITNGRESIDIRFGSDVTAGINKIRAEDNSLRFQIGGNEGQYKAISIASMSATQLGLTDKKLTAVDVTNFDGAQEAIEIIDAAIEAVSSERAELGAFQTDVLESTLSNLRISHENLSAAESSLRDTDMAAEMASFTKHQILQSASISMLAQANQQPQAILSLLG